MYLQRTCWKEDTKDLCLHLFGRILRVHFRLKWKEEFFQNLPKRLRAFYNMSGTFLNVAGKKNVKQFGKQQSDDGWLSQMVISACRQYFLSGVLNRAIV